MKTVETKIVFEPETKSLKAFLYYTAKAYLAIDIPHVVCAVNVLSFSYFYFFGYNAGQLTFFKYGLFFLNCYAVGLPWPKKLEEALSKFLAGFFAKLFSPRHSSHR